MYIKSKEEGSNVADTNKGLAQHKDCHNKTGETGRENKGIPHGNVGIKWLAGIKAQVLHHPPPELHPTIDHHQTCACFLASVSRG